MFLYILKLPKYNCIKIGIATSHTRIKQHIKTYGGVDLAKSYLVHAKNGDTIRQLEKQLLEDYIDYKIDNIELMNKDGYTELRSKDILKDIIQEINYKSDKFKNKEIIIKKGIIIVESKSTSNIVEKLKVKNGVLKLNTNGDNLKNMLTKDDYLFENCNYYIPEKLVLYPMFRWDSGEKNVFEYKLNNTSITCSNTISNKIPNHFDFGVLLSLIQIYLESRSIIKTSQINETDNIIRISFFKICTILEIPPTGYYVDRVKQSLDTLSNTEIIINENGDSIEKLGLINKLYLDAKDINKLVSISPTLLSELKDNRVVMVNKSIFNSSPSPYSKKIYCLINCFLKKKGKLEMSIIDLESIIGSDIEQYSSTRKITKALNYMVDSKVINNYSTENRIVKIDKSKAKISK